MKHVKLGFGLLLLAAGCAQPSLAQPPAEAEPTAFVSRCTGIELELALVDAPQMLQVRGTLHNRGAAPVDLMLTGDGSSAGMRNPTLTFALEPHDVQQLGRCGNINSVQDSDFITLRPGASRALEWIMPPQPASPGRYRLRATYRNDPSDSTLRGLTTPMTPAQVRRLANTTACEVTSDAITFDWDGQRAHPVR